MTNDPFRPRHEGLFNILRRDDLAIKFDDLEVDSFHEERALLQQERHVPDGRDPQAKTGSRAARRATRRAG